MEELVKAFCEENSLSFHDDYSGRCMFGNTCVGFSCTDRIGTIVKLCDYLRDNGIESCSEELGNICSDSLGLNFIVYFPNLVTFREE